MKTEHYIFIILIILGILYMKPTNFKEECGKHGYFITQC